MPLGQYVFTAGTQTETWDQARSIAQSLGGDLASFSTADENNFALSVLAVHTDMFTGDYGPWIGLQQAPGSAEPGGGWGWVDGSAYSYTAWHSGQPDNYQGIDTVGGFYRASGELGWGDYWAGSPLTGLVTELAAGRAGLKGTASADYIYGGAVNNTIHGNAGNDWLDGGGGRDTLVGGGGHDRFVFGDAAAANGDHIQDLSKKDSVDLSGIDADSRASKPGDQSFYLVDHFDGRARELVVHFDGTNTTISGDTDADGQANFTITATGDLSGFSHFVY